VERQDALWQDLHHLPVGQKAPDQARAGADNEEQERHVRENTSEEELVIFDILTRPAPELSTEERAEVKKAARELLMRLYVRAIPAEMFGGF